MRMLIVFALLFMGACGGCDKPDPAEPVDAPAEVTPAAEVTPTNAPAEVTP